MVGGAAEDVATAGIASPSRDLPTSPFFRFDLLAFCKW